MSYIDRGLLPGEHVLYRTRLYWLILAGPVLISILLLPFAWLLLAHRGNEFVWIPIASSLLVVLIVASAIIVRQSSDFAVTNRRVLMKVGVCSTRSIELLLDRIESITVHRSLAGRIFDYGDVIVTGSGGTKEAFRRVQSPLEFRRAIQSAATVKRNPTLVTSSDHQSEKVYRFRSVPGRRRHAAQ